ncbi:hydroxylase [bacterium]|nr:MAG: hydroxylase [bacterium]
MIKIDPEKGVLTVEGAEQEKAIPFSSPEAFEVLSHLWLRCGFDNKYVYGFTWLGRPILQLPEDLVRIQEVIYSVRPDWIIETGVAHGGSLVFYAGICKALGVGRVLGIDIEIRPHNRRALEEHPLRDYFNLLEADSAASSTLLEVRRMVGEAAKILVILDSKHSKDHVLKEMEAYAPLVSVDSYLVAADGIMREVAASPLAGKDWVWNNPLSAVEAFLARHPEFRREEPAFPFNEGQVRQRVTYWPGGFLRKTSSERI